MSDIPEGLDEFVAQDQNSAQRAPASDTSAPAGLDDFIKPEVEQKKYGEGFGNSVKAFLAGAGRAATFGGTDYALTKTGLAKPETLAGLEKYNPVESGVGEVAGIGASLLLAPEASLVGGVSKAGAAITEGAAKLLANPETAGLAAKVLHSVGEASAHAVGSAVEGAAYSLGQSVSESALGDTEALGEKLAPSLMKGALFGAGIGAGFHVLKDAGAAIIPKFFSDTQKAAIESGDFIESVKASDLPDKEGVLSGFSKLKPNHEEIKAAANDIGAPVLAGQISASKAVQKAESALIEGAPTFAASAYQKKAALGFEKVSEAIDSALGAESDHTRATLGESLQNSLKAKVEEQVRPINELYNDLTSKFREIPLDQSAAKSLAKEIMDFEEVSISPSSEQGQLLKRVAGEVGNLKNVNQLKRYGTILSDTAKASDNPGVKHLASVVGSMIDEFQDNSIVSFAEQQAENSPDRDRILDLIKQKKAADAQYAPFKQKLTDLAEALGKKRIAGARSFINFIEDLTPEKVSDRLFAKNDSRFLKFFSENFPEEMQSIAQYQKSLIRESVLKDGELNARQALKKIDKLQPEIKNLIFNEEELKKLNSSKVYLEAMPPKFNTSNTDNIRVYRSAFESPKSAFWANARDYGLSKFVEKSVSTGDSEAIRIANLGNLEREQQKISSKISSAAKDLFSSAKDLEGPAIGYVASKLSHSEQLERHDKIVSKISELQNNPQQMIDLMHETTKDLYAHAPQTAQSATMALARANSFLASKFPVKPEQSVFSPEHKTSPAEIAKFNRYLNAVQKPLDVMQDLKRGTLSMESIEALSAVYPKLYQDMQKQIIDKLTTHMSKKNKEPIPYKTKLSLSMFMQQDMDNSLKQPNIASYQVALAGITAQNKANEQQLVNNQKRSSQKGLESVNLAGRSQTNMQSVSRRNEA